MDDNNGLRERDVDGINESVSSVFTRIYEQSSVDTRKRFTRTRNQTRKCACLRDCVLSAPKMVFMCVLHAKKSHTVNNSYVEPFARVASNNKNIFEVLYRYVNRREIKAFRLIEL